MDALTRMVDLVASPLTDDEVTYGEQNCETGHDLSGRYLILRLEERYCIISFQQTDLTSACKGSSDKPFMPARFRREI